MELTMKKLFLVLFLDYISPPWMMFVDGGKLINIFYDGFSTEYLNMYHNELPGLRLLYELGVRARYLQPVFPAKTWPNFYAQSTGLWAENNGITGNFLYDPVRDESFRNGTNPESKNSHWWDDAEPWWSGAVRQGKKINMYYYLVCEAKIRGVRATKCKKWDPLFVGPEYFEEALYDALDDLVKGRADGTGVYFQMMDSYGHMFGPASSTVKDMVLKVDRILYDFFNYMIRRGYDKQIDVIMSSDHGMQPVSQTRSINITGAFDKMDVLRMLDSGPVVFIWPKEGKLDTLVHNFTDWHPKMKVYRREDTPEHWHYKKHWRIPPLLLVADPTWYLVTPFRGFRNYGKYLRKGEHGFDILHHQSRGIFVAKGPHFKQGYIADPLSNVDIYQIICAILGIQPEAHNGTWSLVEDYFIENPQIISTDGATSVTLNTACVLAMVTIVFVWLY